MIAVLALVTGAYTGLQWAEAEASQQMLDSQSLRVDFEAPARYDLGPWDKGHTFTGGSIGVPVDLAPEWRVTAAFQQKSGQYDEGTWAAMVELREKGPGGRNWWSKTFELEPRVDGNQASLDLNMSELVDQANQMASQAAVPGALEIEIIVRHTAMATTKDGEIATARIARIVVEPRDDLLIPETHDATASFHEAVPKEPPWNAIAAAGVAVLAGGGALVARGRHPKHPVDGAIMVDRLSIPAEAVATDREGLAHLAKQTGNPVLYDVHQNVLLLTGETAFVAWLDGRDEQEPNEDPDRTR